MRHHSTAVLLPLLGWLFAERAAVLGQQCLSPLRLVSGRITAAEARYQLCLSHVQSKQFSIPDEILSFTFCWSTQKLHKIFEQAVMATINIFFAKDSYLKKSISLHSQSCSLE